MIPQALDDAKEKMLHAVEHAQAEFSSLRTGRASSALVERLRIDYYGTEVPLQQLAGFSTPEPHMLIIQPYDKGAISAIEKSIQESQLGLNPSNDGSIIRLVFPSLTAERRKELVKLAKSKAEEGRVAVRNVRRVAKQKIEGSSKEAGVAEADVERGLTTLEKLTHDHIDDIDRRLATKEAELLEV